MSATRLLVLGVVRMYGRAHGYQVRRELLTWSADKWANVQPGSIYHALKKMTAEDLLEQVDVEPGEGGPDRTAYRITREGDQEFHLLLAKALSEPTAAAAEVAAGVSFLTALPRKRAISLLEHRLVILESEERSASLMIEDTAHWGQAEHVAELFRLWSAQARTGLEWTRALIARLAAGDYEMADDAGRAFGDPPA
ncbi:PadR family transcriptional regulator [Amycolatopsis tolypomycina]|uniref:PadR family transcriptional regulator n=1 Tax=Amycolatopsis tolypomycina TaxID=208445 RepID=UPI0033A95A1E